jgi:predicted alpha/beta hydrolase family esterase
MFEEQIDFFVLAQQLHKKISEGSKDKPIIMVYHSFGTYIFANYCRFFSYDRIVGIIDIGGAPIRFYPVIQTFFSDFR